MSFDAHTHLDFPEFDADRDEVVRRARDAGITHALIAGTHPDRWVRTAAVARALAFPYTLGVHPWYLPDEGRFEDVMDQLQTEARAASGIGELGLDHAVAADDAARAAQLRWFRGQLGVARDLDRPIVLHAVRCHEVLLRALEADGVPRAGGMVHDWSGPAHLIPRFVRLGFAISFSVRAIVAPSARRVESLRRTPSAALLFETDCPGRLHGRRTEPADTVAAIDCAAKLLDRPRDEIWAAHAFNARRLWGTHEHAALDRTHPGSGS